MEPSLLGQWFSPEEFLWPCAGVVGVLLSLVLSVIALVTAVRAGRRLRDIQRMLGEKPERAPGRAPAPGAVAIPAARPPAAPPVPPAPPAPPRSAAPPPVAEAPRPPKKPFRLEEVIGLKLFAWVGVIAILAGAGLFVKYAYERGWAYGCGRRPFRRGPRTMTRCRRRNNPAGSSSGKPMTSRATTSRLTFTRPYPRTAGSGFSPAS